MQATELQSEILTSLEDSQAKNIINLDVRELTDVTDFMVICSGTSNRHLHAITDNLVKHVKGLGQRPLGVEGKDSSEWVLVDMGDVVVHIMMTKVREFYSLEKLWANTEQSRLANEN